MTSTASVRGSSPSLINNVSTLTADWEKVISMELAKERTSCSFSYSVQPGNAGEPGFRSPSDPAGKLDLDDREKKEFPTESTYTGQWDPVGMAGFGSFQMPHSVLYQGEMKDGMFHGVGCLRFPQGARVYGEWRRGTLIKRIYHFCDHLQFKEKDWKYCEMPDRRFRVETLTGLQPAGRSHKTQRVPTRLIPAGCFDTGEGFYSPKTKCVYSPDTGAVIRIPTRAEEKWIMQHCRREVDENSGYRPDLYENWEDPQFYQVNKCSSENQIDAVTKSSSTIWTDVFSRMDVSGNADF